MPWYGSRVASCSGPELALSPRVSLGVAVAWLASLGLRSGPPDSAQVARWRRLKHGVGVPARPRPPEVSRVATVGVARVRNLPRAFGEPRRLRPPLAESAHRSQVELARVGEWSLRAGAQGRCHPRSCRRVGSSKR